MCGRCVKGRPKGERKPGGARERASERGRERGLIGGETRVNKRWIEEGEARANKMNSRGHKTRGTRGNRVDWR